jgi:hypothetical protein
VKYLVSSCLSQTKLVRTGALEDTVPYLQLNVRNTAIPQEQQYSAHQERRRGRGGSRYHSVCDKATTRSVLKISWTIPRNSESRLEGSYLVLGLPCHGTEQRYRERRLILKESWGVHIHNGRLTMPLASLGQRKIRLSSNICDELEIFRSKTLSHRSLPVRKRISNMV